MKKYYAVTDDGGHAAGDKRMIDALLTLPGWKPATHEEYLQAKHKARKDDTDLVAAALGLKSSAVAQATIHLMGEPEINAAINGEHIEGPDK